MKTFQDQLSIFLELSSVTAYRLSKISGVPRSTLSKMLAGKQNDARMSTVNALHEAMRNIDPIAAKKAIR
jgi:predicted transcriptional regulator